MTRPTLRIASRGSQLALWQAHHVRDALRARDAELHVEIVHVHTTGDRLLDVPLSQIGDRGLFTKEIDEVLLRGDADLAVHSLKDVPTQVPDGLCLAAIGPREDPRDVVLPRAGTSARLAELPAGARVGTSSLRRRAQLAAARPELEVVDLRGNLNTRLAKLDAGDYDAIVLAAAGVLRLGWEARIGEYLQPPGWLPAVGQGALAIVVRSSDAGLLQRLRALHDAPTAACVRAERALLHALEGGCQVPIGALARADGERLSLDALISDLDGRRLLRDSAAGSAAEPEALGHAVADALLAQGAEAILDAIRRLGGARPAPAAP